MKKVPVGVLGCTGMVGQQYLSLLDNHPWFEVTFLAASEKSSGKTYEEATHQRLHVKTPFSRAINSQPVHSIDSIETAKSQCALVFSALESDAAKIYEERYAKIGLPVVSNASAHRKSSDVPLLIPEINAHHLDIIPLQQKNRGWDKGFIVVKPNCSLQSYLAPLYAIHKHFPVSKVILTTMQAVSGAGWPGVSSFDIIDNIIPYIAGEEEKSEQEPMKILGAIVGNQIESSQAFTLSAHCNRVPVIDGHLACVSLGFHNKVPKENEVLQLWNDFKGKPQELKLPSAPLQPIIYKNEDNRPQPRLDRDNDKAMAITCGRLRPCPVLDLRFVGLSHNTGRGAAGGGILNAELLLASGWIQQ